MNNYSKNVWLVGLVITGTIFFFCNNLIAQNIVESDTKRNLSLDDCIHIAAENNRQVLIINEGLNQADAKVDEARSRFYPTIAINLTDRP